MSAEEYRELVVSAQDAMRRLIAASEPGTAGVILLNEAFGELAARRSRADRALDRTGEPASAPDTRSNAQRVQAQRDDWNRRRNAWRLLDERVRRHAVIETIAEHRLTVREIIDAVVNQLPEDSADADVYYSDVYGLLRRMLDDGEVDREPAEIVKGRRVWRYHRKTKLSGAIAEIAEQFSNDE